MRHEDFGKKNVRVVVISNDKLEASKKTQSENPHLIVVADEDQKLAKAIQVIHAGAKHGEDTNSPTTFIVDGTGTVRWWDRQGMFIARFSPDEVLAAIDKAGLQGPGAK